MSKQESPQPGAGREDPAKAAAFEARSLLRAARSGILATQQGGQPHASLVTPAVLPDGCVLMLLSALAQHTRHLDAEPRCALVAVGAAEDANLQTAPRVTLTGSAARAADPALRRYWLDRHPYARLYADFADFSVWRLVPESAQFVGGFGRAFTMRGAAFLPPAASVEAVAGAAPALLARFAADQGAVDRAAHACGRHGRWQLLAVDVDGVDMVQDEEVLRIPFDAPAAGARDAEAALERLLRSG